ncbi:hypothetical protein CB0940_08540 [Lecanosticta acicola]|uniref:Mediator complex subunit 22 n=1 Tax=Lecanosticta acicola TaxID=111012 RepID=A0AAI8Z4L3_9PEZI|nr:hypothetical protein CB0940_08540 [Lecanosticta acicola]
MEPSLRNTRELSSRIDKMQSELLRRFQALVDLTASVKKKDRSATAVVQYQIQSETKALIKSVEDVQSLIRQLQEMWLFGQLDTLGESQVQKATEENARVVALLLGQLAEKGFGVGVDGVGVDGGGVEDGRMEFMAYTVFLYVPGANLELREADGAEFALQ